MMERLTHQGEQGPYWDKSVFDKHGGMEEDLIINRLAYYEDMEEQGRLVVLPCKVGDWVYGYFPRYSRNILDCKVVKVKACQFHNGTMHHFVDVEFYIENPYFDDGRLMLHGHQAVVAECFGSWDRVFLTREDAERALKEGAEHE